jgi:hypothetical protein
LICFLVDHFVFFPFPPDNSQILPYLPLQTLFHLDYYVQFVLILISLIWGFLNFLTSSKNLSYSSWLLFLFPSPVVYSSLSIVLSPPVILPATSANSVSLSQLYAKGLHNSSRGLFRANRVCFVCDFSVLPKFDPVLISNISPIYVAVILVVFFC